MPSLLRKLRNRLSTGGRRSRSSPRLLSKENSVKSRPRGSGRRRRSDRLKKKHTVVSTTTTTELDVPTQFIITPEVSPVSDLGLSSPVQESSSVQVQDAPAKKEPLTQLVRPSAPIQDDAIRPVLSAPLEDEANKQLNTPDPTFSRQKEPVVEVQSDVVPVDGSDVDEKKMLAVRPSAPEEEVVQLYSLELNPKMSTIPTEVDDGTQSTNSDKSPPRTNHLPRSLEAHQISEKHTIDNESVDVSSMRNMKEPSTTQLAHNLSQSIPTRDQIQIGSTMVDIVKGTNRGKRGVAVGWMNKSTLRVKVIKASSCIVNVRLTSVTIVTTSNNSSPSSRNSPKSIDNFVKCSPSYDESAFAPGQKIEIIAGAHKAKSGQFVTMKNKNTCLVELNGGHRRQVHVRLSSIRDILARNVNCTKAPKETKPATKRAITDNALYDFVQITAGQYKGKRGRLRGRNRRGTYDVEINSRNNSMIVKVRKSSLEGLGEF